MTPPRFPVSIKGVVAIDGKFCLLRNEREEWELPGGRLEAGEDPVAACVREIDEELGLAVRVTRILDSWLYDIKGAGEVLIVTYACAPLAGVTPRISHEHKALGLFAPDEIAGLAMPEGYRRSIAAWSVKA